MSISSISSGLSALFSKLDTSNKGYLSESDLESAFSKVSSSSDSTSQADALFKELDSNNDGQVSQDEFSTGLQNLASQLDSQFLQSKFHGHRSNSSSDGTDQGLTKDQLTQIAATSTDSNFASLASTLASNFSAADTNGDGKITHEEAEAYQKSIGATSGTSQSQAAYGPPPPPPGGGQDAGLTKDQLTELASTTSDSKLANLFSTLAANFSAADTNGDGKVTRDEAKAYQESQASTASSSNSSSTSTTSANNDISALLNILKLAQTYGVFGTDSSNQNSNISSLLSVA